MANRAQFRTGYGRRKPGPWARVDGAHPLARGLVGCWLINEGGGASVYDRSGKNNTGTVQAGATWSRGRLSGPGLLFDGLTGAVTVPSTTALQLTADWTYAVWVQTATTLSAGGAHPLFSHWTNSGSGRQIYLYLTGNSSPAGKVQVDVPFIAAILTGATVLTDGLWHQVTVTKAGTTWTIYVDGVQDAQTTNAAAQEACATNLEWGFSTPASRALTGSLDVPFIGSRALPAAEVLLLYQQPLVFLQQTPPRQSAAFAGAAVGTPGPYYYLFPAGMGG